MSGLAIPLHPTSKTLRQFAGTWLVFFLSVGAFQYWGRGREHLGLALGALAVALGGLGLWKPAALRWLYVGWMAAAFPIGWLGSQLVMVVVFYGVITPVALICRFRGRDVLCRKPAPDRATFWTLKLTAQELRSYFRQY
jgi:hypothetical protein